MSLGRAGVVKRGKALWIGGRALTRVLRRVVLRKAFVLEHVQQRGLARIVETQEEDLRVLVGEACETSAPG